MKLGKRTEIKETKKPHIFQKIILYLLVIAFTVSFISSIVISLLLIGSEHDMSININGKPLLNSESPVLGQFGPISTVILLLGIPLLILITLIAFSFYVSVGGIKEKLGIF
tara:strand:+ start:1431 stop:1763 length:333 start_codon:yes stop_codon:yes gene_type:complete